MKKLLIVLMSSVFCISAYEYLEQSTSGAPTFEKAHRMTPNTAPKVTASGTTYVPLTV